MYKVGDIFKHKHSGVNYILSQIGTNEMMLISLLDGNRWNDGVKFKPEEFLGVVEEGNPIFLDKTGEVVFDHCEDVTIKVERTYRIGDIFLYNYNYYMLVLIDNNFINMYKITSNRNNRGKKTFDHNYKVSDCYNITQKELSGLIGDNYMNQFVVINSKSEVGIKV